LWAWDGTVWRKVLIDANGKLQVDVASGLDVDSNLHGYDGAVWQPLRTQSASGSIATGIQTLITKATNYLWHQSWNFWLPQYVAALLGDANAGDYIPITALMSFNGVKWDRLRSYGTGILKVGRAEVGAALARLTAAGAVVGGAKKLMWLTIRPSAANWVLELTDAVAGGGAVKWDVGGAAVEPHHCVFDPPIEFSAGIYLETFTNLTSVMFSYV